MMFAAAAAPEEEEEEATTLPTLPLANIPSTPAAKELEMTKAPSGVIPRLQGLLVLPLLPFEKLEAVVEEEPVAETMDFFDGLLGVNVSDAIGDAIDAECCR